MEKPLSVWRIVKDFLNSLPLEKEIKRSEILDEVEKYYHSIRFRRSKSVPMYNRSYNYKYVWEILRHLQSKGYIWAPAFQGEKSTQCNPVKVLKQIPIELTLQQIKNSTKEELVKTTESFTSKKESFWKRFFNMIYLK